MDDDFYQNFRIYELDRRLTNASSAAREGESEIDRIKRQFNKMSLVNQALFELLQDRLDLTEKDLRRKVREIDQRDGLEDGQTNPSPLTCPKCNATVSAGALSCYACGATLAPTQPFSP